jgi:hypothetical protein
VSDCISNIKFYEYPSVISKVTGGNSRKVPRSFILSSSDTHKELSYSKISSLETMPASFS